MTPTEIKKLAGGAGMKITWTDGTQKELSGAVLRRECQCAACRHEITGARLLDPSKVAEDTKILKAEILGNYALGFLFSDGHSTGIYTFDFLRKLGQI